MATTRQKANRATDGAKKQVSKARYQAYRAPAKRYTKQQRRAAPRTNMISKQLPMKIPACTVDYINALFDPFNTMGGVCIPADQFPLPSQKSKVFLRGSFALGASGVGFIGLAPSPWNNLTSINHTTATSVGTVNTLFTDFTNLGAGIIAFAQLPFNDADRAAKTVQARVVASGIRIRYSGTELNRQGLYVACEAQDLDDLASTQSFTSLRSQLQAQSKRPSGDGDWDQTVCYSGPVSPQCLEFTGIQYPLNNIFGETAQAARPMVIGCTGGNGDVIEYEAVIHVEYVGSKCNGKTPSHSDTNSYGKVAASVKSVAAVGPVQPAKFGAAWGMFTNMLSDAADQIISQAHPTWIPGKTYRRERSSSIGSGVSLGAGVQRAYPRKTLGQVSYRGSY